MRMNSAANGSCGLYREDSKNSSTAVRRMPLPRVTSWRAAHPIRASASGRKSVKSTILESCFGWMLTAENNEHVFGNLFWFHLNYQKTRIVVLAPF